MYNCNCEIKMSGNSNILEDSYNYSDFKYSIDDVDDNLTLKWINWILFQVVLVLFQKVEVIASMHA